MINDVQPGMDIGRLVGDAQAVIEDLTVHLNRARQYVALAQTIISNQMKAVGAAAPTPSPNRACLKCTRPALDKRRVCRVHHNQRTRQLKKQHMRLSKDGQRHCYDCDMPVAPGAYRCEACNKRRLAASYRRRLSQLEGNP